MSEVRDHNEKQNQGLDYMKDMHENLMQEADVI